MLALFLICMEKHMSTTKCKPNLTIEPNKRKRDIRKSGKQQMKKVQSAVLMLLPLIAIPWFKL